MKDIMVSICCITYNHEHYIADALEGFLMQKANFNFEVLIHDDASTDNTASIIRKYVEKHPDIIKPIYQTENQYSKGVRINSTFNITRAQGKYLSICEGDDYWTSPVKLQTQVDYMETHPDCTLCFHAARIFNGDNLPTGKNVQPYDRDLICPTEDIIRGGGGFCPTVSLLFPKKQLETFPPFYFNAFVSDYPLQMLLASRGYAYYLNDFMAVYRTDVKGSWTSLPKTMTRQKAREHYNMIYRKDIQLLTDFDTFTDYRFTDTVKETISILEYEICINNVDLRKLKSKECRGFYCALPFRRRIKLLYEYYMNKVSRITRGN
jgi:glycosyltransferase involved in cell wall biosynthesis